MGAVAAVVEVLAAAFEFITAAVRAATVLGFSSIIKYAYCTPSAPLATDARLLSLREREAAFTVPALPSFHPVTHWFAIFVCVWLGCWRLTFSTRLKIANQCVTGWKLGNAGTVKAASRSLSD